MRGRLEFIEAFEAIVRGRPDARLMHNGGKGSAEELQKGQEEFASDRFVRMYDLKARSGRHVMIKFVYVYSIDGCDASVYIRMADIMVLREEMKDLDRIVSGVRNNGHFKVTNVTNDSASVSLKSDKITED